MHFEFQFESELAFISKFRSEFLEFVLQFKFTCASDVEGTLFCLRQGHVGRYGGPSAFLISKNLMLNHFLVCENVTFGPREGHWWAPELKFLQVPNSFCGEPAGGRKVVIIAESSSQI